MKLIWFISRLLTGVVFVFSGFVKAVDPAGSAIKFREYFEAFHLDFLVYAAMPLAIALSAAELMIGLNLIARFRMKFTAWALLLFMSFFTLLTLILALTNPVSDCGCFGDALKLTNWQTFGKNIILLLPSIAVFHGRKELSVPALSYEWGMVALNFTVSCLLSVYCILHQPLLDFRPYGTGTYIPEKMTIPEGAPMDEYETILVYEKNGVQQEFTDKNFPWQDTLWKWVETRQTIIRKGYEPPIHDFSITCSDGSDITPEVLADTGYSFVIIAPDLEHSAARGMEKMNHLALRCNELGFRCICLTSSANSEVTDFINSFQPAFEICSADETTLKTILRANPGLLLLRGGTILGKWNYRDAPEPEEISRNMLSAVLEKQRGITETRDVTLLALGIVIVYMLYFSNRKRLS
jgi:uncharacterized membrane protein YphA (DoxX/SURF4 family)